MKHHGLTLSRLDRFIEHNLRLEKLGFTSSDAELLASELAKIGFTPQQAAIRLKTLLLQYDELQNAVAKLTIKRDTVQQDFNIKNAERYKIIMQLDNLTVNLNKLKLQIQQAVIDFKNKQTQFMNESAKESHNHRELHKQEMIRLNTKFASKEYQLDKKIIKLENKRNDLRFKVQERTEKLTTLKDTINEAEKVISVLEKKLNNMETIRALVSLIEGSVSSKDKASLLKAVIAILKGLETHLHKDLQFVSEAWGLSKQLDDVIEILAGELKDESE